MKTEAPKPTGKGMLERYGGVFVGVVMFLFVIEMAVIMTALRNGVDFGPVVAWCQNTLGLDASYVLESAGTLGVAYAITRLLKPFQLMAAAALTPIVARQLGRDAAEPAAVAPAVVAPAGDASSPPEP
jgi:hypothetical protein